jgi:hypothetical protein
MVNDPPIGIAVTNRPPGRIGPEVSEEPPTVTVRVALEALSIQTVWPTAAVTVSGSKPESVSSTLTGSSSVPGTVSAETAGTGHAIVPPAITITSAIDAAMLQLFRRPVIPPSTSANWQDGNDDVGCRHE